MSFWSLKVTPNSSFSQSLDEPIRLTNASLGAEVKSDKRTSVVISVDGEEAVVCSLVPEKIEQCLLDLVLDGDIEISLVGDNEVYLCGNAVEVEEDEGHMCYSDGEEYSGDEEMDMLMGGQDGEDEEIYSDQFESEEFDEDMMGEEEDDLEPKIVELSEDEAVSVAEEPKPVEVKELPAKKNKPEPKPKQEKQEKKQKQNKAVEEKKPEAKEQKQKETKVEAKLEKKEKPAKEAKTPEKKEVKQEKAEKKEEKKAEKRPSEADSEQPSKKVSFSSTPEQKHPSGLITQDIQVGTGATAKQGQRVSVRYIGKLTSGKTFDSNTKGKPFNFVLGKGEVIKGWDMGVQGMKVGGVRKLTCPPKLAYGAQGAPPDIPKNATLVFEVKLLAINGK